MAYRKIIENEETAKCLLCHNAECETSCKKNLPVARMIRSIRMDNRQEAEYLMPEDNPCITCKDMDCMKNCSRGKMDSPVNIRYLLSGLTHNTTDRVLDLSIDFCGVKCENPFFLSSSIVGSNYEMVAKAFDMGWAGVAFKTIGMFVPEEVSPRFDKLAKENNPFIGFKNIEQISDHTLQDNIGYIKQLKNNYPNKVIIASIMGRNEAEWTFLASEMEKAGADIIECNFSCPHMSGKGLGSDIGTNPKLVSLYTKAVKKGTSLPVLAKMTPNITNMEIPALAAVNAGADGIAAINTIKSIMNINTETYSSGPDVIGKSSVGGYSGKAVKPIALRFINDMKQTDKLKSVPISGMGGIETWRDAVEFMLLGCETVQITTAVMQYGYRIIDDLISGLSSYLGKIKAKAVKDIVGKALPNILPAEDLNRSSISYPKFDSDICVKCGRCYIACFDAGHQALTIGKDKRPKMNPEKCVGCQLCKVVCPVEAINCGVRINITK